MIPGKQTGKKINEKLTDHNYTFSNRQYLSNDDCLEDKKEDYQNCSVLYVYDSCPER